MTHVVALTVLEKRCAGIASIEDPDARLSAARALVPAVAETLADERIGEETAVRIWLQLARRATGRPARPAERAPYSRPGAERAARVALGMDGSLAGVRAATEAIAAAEARHAVELAGLRHAQAEAVRAARDAGQPIEPLVEVTGTSRQTVYDMIHGRR